MFNDPERLVYLDCQATERPFPETVAAMLPHMTGQFGNPSALVHASGRGARAAVEQARQIVSRNLNASYEGVVFTSGATEANNLVLQSMASRRGRKVMASAIEHKSVLAPLERLNDLGVETLVCPVHSTGELDLERLADHLDQNVALVSVMLANNEIGTIQPIEQISAMCKQAGAWLHVDAAQAVGKVAVDFKKLGADFLTVSGHKFGGPQGSGILVFDPARLADLTPLQIGGGQEDGIRAGTIPVPLCVGIAVALEKATRDRERHAARMFALRQRIIDAFTGHSGFFINGTMKNRLPSNLSAGFEGVSALSMMRKMPEICISAGSACTTGSMENHVLNAIGVGAKRRDATFRLSLGWSTTEADVDHVIHRIPRILHQLPMASGAI
jgi:cysteine desulfurase